MKYTLYNIIIAAVIVSGCSPGNRDDQYLLSINPDRWILKDAALINSAKNPILGTRITPKQLMYQNGKWTLLYQGHYPGGKGSFKRTNLPALAFSNDFYNWSDDARNPIWSGEGTTSGWEGNRAMPEAFIIINNRYYLYYGGSNPDAGVRAIGLAIGIDLYNIKALPKPVITPNSKNMNAITYSIFRTFFMQ